MLDVLIFGWLMIGWLAYTMVVITVEIVRRVRRWDR